MLRRLIPVLGLPLLAAALSVSVASAQTPVTASYVAGWNMVGGPTGTVFTGAAYVDAYSATGYTSSTMSAGTGCQGYWAYFVEPASVDLPPAAGPTESCPLQSGWNLVGNPFSGAAALPAGTPAFHWNPDRGTYDVVSTIPVGASAWLYSPDAASVDLSYVPLTTSTPATLEIDGLLGNVSYTVHVGDSVKLLLPITTLYRADTDPRYLHLETAGQSGDISCLGSQTGCAISIVNQFWTWHAITPGVAAIILTPLCRSEIPACELPSATIRITILS